MTVDGEITDESSGYTVFFEDDGRVAYAYLLNREGGFVGDCWLYNRQRTPERPEWTDLRIGPFTNSAGYVHPHDDLVPVNDFFAEVDAEFEVRAGAAIRARVFIRGELFAILEEGAKPGWARLARRDGPAAKVLFAAD